MSTTTPDHETAFAQTLPELPRLRMLAIILPTATVVAIEVFTAVTEVRGPHFSEWVAHGLFGALMVILIIPFSIWVFRWFDRITETLMIQRDAVAKLRAELEALNEAGLSLASNRSLQEVLDGVVRLALDLLHARRAQLDVTDRRYADVGTLHAEATRGGDRSGDSEGEPALRAAIVYQDHEIGSLLVSGPRDRAFDASDQALLHLFAAHAAVAMVNARMRARDAAYAALEERARIGRELHDSFGQVLGYVSTKAQSVEEYMRSDRCDQALNQLVELQEAVRSLYTDVRGEIFNLRGAGAQGRGLAGNLAAYVSQFERFAGVHVSFDTAGELPDLSPRPGVEAHITRIVQEALTNVRKHARAQHVWVTLASDGYSLDVTVRDDGIGFAPLAPLDGEPRFGLRTMDERANLIGGVLRVASEANEGTLVELRLPLA
ncbi:MAG: GAF domain-containing sensor histidine kinase [Dehalococcoidia bacterium]